MIWELGSILWNRHCYQEKVVNWKIKSLWFWSRKASLTVKIARNVMMIELVWIPIKSLEECFVNQFVKGNDAMLKKA